MALENQIQEEMKLAMRAKDKPRLEALRSIKSAILLSKTEKGAQSGMNEDDEIKLLQRLLKQRKDSASIYREQNRLDLAEVEESQAEVIQSFLPQPMTEDELEKLLREVIAQTGAEGPKDMGKVMGAANAKIAGRAEGKTVATLVKKLLA
jgi:uncharacterized protein YqeY